MVENHHFSWEKHYKWPCSIAMSAAVSYSYESPRDQMDQHRQDLAMQLANQQAKTLKTWRRRRDITLV